MCVIIVVCNLSSCKLVIDTKIKKKYIASIFLILRTSIKMSVVKLYVLLTRDLDFILKHKCYKRVDEKTFGKKFKLECISVNPETR